MKVLRGWSTNKDWPLVKPFLEKSGIFVEFRGGDFIFPKGKGEWFKPPYFPKGVFRSFLTWPWLPFITIRIGNWGMYFGAKAFGVDAPAYKEWMCDPAEVYDGSQAIMFSIRMSRALGK